MFRGKEEEAVEPRVLIELECEKTKKHFTLLVEQTLNNFNTV